jgi:hypothetical protein
LDKRSAEALDNCKFKVVYNPIAKRYYPMVKAPGSGWASLGRKLLNLKPGDGYCVRYANGDPRDCCRSNLKKMTRAEVAYSREKGNTGDRRTSCRGVTFNACKATYQAKLYKDKKMYNLGKFDNEQDAIIARDKAALRYYGKFAKLGFMHAMKDYMVIRDKATATVAKGLSNLFK